MERGRPEMRVVLAAHDRRERHVAIEALVPVLPCRRAVVVEPSRALIAPVVSPASVPRAQVHAVVLDR